MKKYLFIILMCFSTVCSYAQVPAVRAKKFMGEASLTASLTPNFAIHDKEMLQFGAGFGWNATEHLYLGVGSSWIQYFGDANALPVFFNPRIYFANEYNGSWFVDFRAGGIVYAPDKTVDGSVIHADRKSRLYGGLGIGHLFTHVSASIGFDIYPAINETDKLTKQDGGYPCGCLYFRLAYLF